MSAKKLEVPMMDGSSTTATYMAFAKTAGMALGIKPVAVMPGSKLGVPGCTWFGARLRSAPAGNLFNEQEGKVVKLSKIAAMPKEAWPHITWDKSNKDRASTTIGVMLHGGPESHEQAALLISQIQGKKLATKMVDYLEQIAGKENFLISRKAAIAWFDEQYQAFVKGLQATMDTQKALTDALKDDVGTFHTHAEILKKVYAKTAGANADDIEDSDEDEEDEG